jgi:hypothetical protein
MRGIGENCDAGAQDPSDFPVSARTLMGMGYDGISIKVQAGKPVSWQTREGEGGQWGSRLLQIR